MKPKIWRQDGLWICAYNRNDVAGRGFTPYLAWYVWRYKITYGR